MAGMQAAGVGAGAKPHRVGSPVVPPETPFEFVFSDAHAGFAEVPHCIKRNRPMVVEAAAGTAPARWNAEVVLGPNTAEYVFDIFILAELRALQTRRGRGAAKNATGSAAGRSAAVPVRVIDAPLFSSHVAGDCAGSNHSERVRALGAAIDADVARGGPGAKGAVVLLGGIDTGSYASALLPKLHGAISVMVDRNFWTPAYLKGPMLVQVPYVAHSQLATAAAAEPAPLPLASRTVSVTFWGSTRSGAGRLRKYLQVVAEAWWPSASLKHQGVVQYKTLGKGKQNLGKNGTRSIEQQQWAMSSLASYSDAMRSAALCLVPEGDTLTSRRLFDALAAGCVPVIFGPICGRGSGSSRKLALNLPFAAWIEWDRAAVFVNGLACAAASANARAALGARLAVLAAAASPMLVEARSDAAAGVSPDGMRALGESMRDMQAYGAEVYRRWLSYGHGWPFGEGGDGGAGVSGELGSGPAAGMLAEAAKFATGERGPTSYDFLHGCQHKRSQNTTRTGADASDGAGRLKLSL